MAPPLNNNSLESNDDDDHDHEIMEEDVIIVVTICMQIKTNNQHVTKQYLKLKRDLASISFGRLLVNNNNTTDVHQYDSIHNTLRINDARISREQFLISMVPNNNNNTSSKENHQRQYQKKYHIWLIPNPNATNPVRVNGKRIQDKTLLQIDSCINVGGTECRILDISIEEQGDLFSRKSSPPRELKIATRQHQQHHENNNNTNTSKRHLLLSSNIFTTPSSSLVADWKERCYSGLLYPPPNDEELQLAEECENHYQLVLLIM
jgi:pSer/pThr/pTyr-binding forkhead associated (FHA) protein